jgi:hypothetical protein
MYHLGAILSFWALWLSGTMDTTGAMICTFWACGLALFSR